MRVVAIILALFVVTGFVQQPKVPQMHVSEFRDYDWRMGNVIAKYAVEMNKKGFETKSISVWCPGKPHEKCYGVIIMQHR